MNSISCSAVGDAEKSSDANNTTSLQHLQQQEQHLKHGDMQCLLKDVYQVHLKFVNELEQVKKRCSKLEKANNMLLNKNQELQSRNTALSAECSSHLSDVSLLKTKLTLPCEECNSLREQMKLTQTALNSMIALVNKEGTAESSRCQKMDTIELVTQADLPLDGNTIGTSESISGCLVKNSLGNQMLSQSISDKCDRRIVPQRYIMESKEPDDDKPRRVSDEASATVRKDSTGCSSEEKAKSLKLTRSDQRVKCRYTEEPAVDVCKVGSSSDSPSTVVENNQQSKSGNSPRSLCDTRAEMETGQHVTNTRTKVSNEQFIKTLIMRPNITVPESLPFDFEEDESDSFNAKISVPDSHMICGDGIQSNNGTKHKDHHSESSKPVNEFCAPDSPVFNRGQQMIVTPVYSSPSLFDDEDERSSARKQRLAAWSSMSKPIANESLSSCVPLVIDSPSILKRDIVHSITAVVPEGSAVRSRLSDMEVNLLDQTALSPPSPSVLSQKLTYYDDLKLPALSVNQTTIQAQVDNTVERNLPEIEQIRGKELICNTSKLTLKLSTGFDSEITCVKTASGTVDKMLCYDECKCDPDETVCPFQTSYVSCDESLSILSNINIPLGDSPQKLCDLLDSENVMTSLASLQTVSVSEPNGSLAVGIELSEYTNDTENAEQLLAENIVTGHESRSVMKNKRMTRSQSQQSSYPKILKRQRLDDKLTSDLSSDELVFDPCNSSKPVDTHFLQDIGNVQENRLQQDIEVLGGLDNEVDVDDSFDRVPKNADVNYKYVEVVRKHHLRRQMDAFACLQCQQIRGPATGKAQVPIVDSLNGGTTKWLVPAERRDCRLGRSATQTTGPERDGWEDGIHSEYNSWFNGLNLSKDELADRMKHCRHKATSEPTSTPDHFWSVGFPTTQQGLEKGYLGETSSKPSEFRRKKGLRKLFQSGHRETDDCNTK